MNQTPLLNLITDFVDDFRQPAILWQALVIIACLALSWVFVRQLRAVLARRADAAVPPVNADDLQGAIVADCGHFIMEEQPAAFIAHLLPFLAREAA